jgi:hypothetical protein
MADAVMHTIHQADLLAHLRGNRWLVQNGYIPKAHAILCDPPYGLAFMGKEWDTLGAVEFQAWVTEWAGLLIDYVHPGALGLFFGGTRTYHRLAAGLEDAGWEITDCIMWVHGQGFPKSAAIGKLLDKEAGAAREVVGESATRLQLTDAQFFGWNAKERTANGGVPITAPATPLAARWEGYGTALKPAFEPVVVARAPRGKRTYAALAREFGTGALAIDAARIVTSADDVRSGGFSAGNRPWVQGSAGNTVKVDGTTGRWPANFALVCTCESDDHAADCPAADCPVAVLGTQSGETGNGYRANESVKRDQHQNSVYGKYRDTFEVGERGHNDTGTAARFFYQAKAASWEREAGLHDRTRRNVNDGRHTPIDNPFQRGETKRLNVHPTVKPIRLAEYLARLILPPAGDEPRRLLVPFAGSGSEMIGALLAGWDVVTGIEREAEYVDLARARVGWWAQFATYDEARAAYEQERKAKPAPVVIDEKPYTLPMLIMEQVCTSANA